MRHCRFLYAIGNGLIRNFYMCSNNVKIKLFQSYCCNIYTGQLWYKYKASTMNKVKVAYNTMFRMLLNVPRYQNGSNYSASGLFAQHCVVSFQALLRKLIYSFEVRVSLAENKVLRYFSDTNVRFRSELWEHWSRQLRPS